MNIDFHIILLYIYLIPFIISLTELPMNILNTQLQIPKYQKSLNNNSLTHHLIKSFKEETIDGDDITLVPSSLFSLSLKIGTPKKIFNLLVDTGSTIMWIPNIISNDTHKIKNHYDPNNSSSCIKLNEKFEEIYGSGSCSGDFYYDKLNYIGDKEFKLKFGVAKKTNFNVDGVDGVLGLSRNYEDKFKSFISMLNYADIFKSNIFSIKINDNSTKNFSAKFYIGKHPDFDKNDVVTCELLHQSLYFKELWGCEMNSIIIGNSTYFYKVNENIPVIFDTGTNVIILPTLYIEDFYNKLSEFNCEIKLASNSFESVSYQLVCKGNNYPEFKFVIDGHTFILPNEYAYYVYRKIAYSRIIFIENKDDDDDVFIIGSPFFMVFHVLFDSDSKELHFYSENKNYLIKGSWWNKKHIIIVVISGILVIGFILMIIFFVRWKKVEKEQEKLENFIWV